MPIRSLSNSQVVRKEFNSKTLALIFGVLGIIFVIVTAYPISLVFRGDWKVNQKVDIALRLTVGLETIKKRILERKNLEKREDDTEDIAVKRFKTYESNIKPIIDFYKQCDLLKEVNGELSITEISDEISRLIDGIKG